MQFYKNNADFYFEKTFNNKVAAENNYNELKIGLTNLSPNAKIFEFGCGSCRDLFFLTNKGYDVYGVDGSEELVVLAQTQTNLKDKIFVGDITTFCFHLKKVMAKEKMNIIDTTIIIQLKS